MRKYSTALEQVLLTRQMHVCVVIVVTVTTTIHTGVTDYPPIQHIHVVQHPNNAIHYDQQFGGLLYHLTLRRLMSYIYGAPILDVSRSHTTTQHSR